MRPRVVVVGGGITGLVAARALADAGVDVVVCEADARPGGQVRSLDVNGVVIDVGAEAVHLGAPGPAALVRELGLDVSVLSATQGASVMSTRKGLRPLPAGVGPTGPTRLRPVLASGILSFPGLMRAGLEPLMARRKFSHDTTVGAFTRRRFGNEVTDTFVDPLLGNLHAGDIDSLSLHSTAAQLVPAATGGRSLVMRRKPTHAPRSGVTPLPMFANWPGGLTTLVDAIASSSGAHLLTNARVSGLERVGDVWRVHLADGTALDADRVLLTTPAHVTAELLRPHAGDAADALAAIPLASVATVTLGFDRAATESNRVLRDHNGILLSSRQARTFKAATNLTRKWRLGGDLVLVRASVGRIGSDLADTLDDQTMVARIAAELADLIDLRTPVGFSHVARFPRAMPQLVVGHGPRVGSARAAIAGSGLALAGCALDGLGLVSTINSGTRAAAALVAELEGHA
ncbi:MAG TPA: protoporphyrinogen oxidase [Propionibacteriaceae bacterium]|nr:protoporphyrinogen oxidase [Propionibacteriaceae bacterium]